MYYMNLTFNNNMHLDLFYLGFAFLAGLIRTILSILVSIFTNYMRVCYYSCILVLVLVQMDCMETDFTFFIGPQNTTFLDLFLACMWFMTIKQAACLVLFSSADPSDRGMLDAGIKTAYKQVYSAVGSLFGKGPNKKPGSWYDVYLKVYLFIQYTLMYFFIYTKLGNALFFIGMFVMFNSGPQDGCYQEVSFLLVTFIMTNSIQLYILVQFEYPRNLLIGLIGETAFKTYMGENPGSMALARMVSRGAVYAVAGAGGAYATSFAVVYENAANADNYVKTMERIGQTPDSAVIGNIYAKSNTIIGRILSK